MLLSMIRWELRLLRREPAIWIAACALLIAQALAIASGVAWVRAQRRASAEAQEHQEAHRLQARTTAEHLTQHPDPCFPWWKDPRVASAYSGNAMVNYAALPPGPLASLTVGQSDLHILRISTQSPDTIPVCLSVSGSDEGSGTESRNTSAGLLTSPCQLGTLSPSDIRKEPRSEPPPRLRPRPHMIQSTAVA